MPLPHPVTLLGFRHFERSALASYFRLAVNRSPAYEQVAAPAEARFIVADAELPEVVATVQAAGRLADTVFVGSPVPAGAAAGVARPIDPLKVLRELDAMVAARQPEAQGQRTIILPPRPARAEGSGFVAVPAMPPPAPPAPRQGLRALLVDDSEIALRYLETRLRQAGLQTECASTSGQALERLSHGGYDFVFIDVDLGEASDLDGLALCQHLRRQHHPAGDGRVPRLAIVSAFHAEVDRARGSLAGADAYFGKPLDDAALLAWLRLNGVKAP